MPKDSKETINAREGILAMINENIQAVIKIMLDENIVTIEEFIDKYRDNSDLCITAKENKKEILAKLKELRNN